MFELFGLKSRIADSSRVFGVGWQRLVEQATEHALREGHQLLIVDTFSGLSGLGPDQENDAGAIAERLRPLRVASSRGLAVLFVHHTNKHGRKGPRGSGALRGLIDTSIGFQREGTSNRFSLRTESRFGLEQLRLQGVLTISSGTATYRLLGSPSDGHTSARPVDTDELLWRTLPVGADNALSYQQIADRSGLSIDQVERRLREWHKPPERDELGRAGKGHERRSPPLVPRPGVGRIPCCAAVSSTCAYTEFPI
jgi:AAA domain